MSVFDSIKGATSELIGKANQSVSSLLDPKNARMAISGLFPGGANSQQKTAAKIGFKSDGKTVPSEDDWRVRISLSPNNKIFYHDDSNTLLKPLTGTNGVVFPYTPSITVSHTATYNPASVTHSNYSPQFYQNSDVSDITISGDFTVQNATEGQYLLAAIYFFRSATKMFFGVDSKTGSASGNPPPMVYLDGYGEHYFPHVQCVITNFSHTLPNEVDYIEVPVVKYQTIETNVGTVQGAVAGVDYPNWGSKPSKTGQIIKSTSYDAVSTSTTRLPTSSNISITLRPVYSRKSLHDKFNLNDFSAGKLLKGNGGFL